MPPRGYKRFSLRFQTTLACFLVISACSLAVSLFTVGILSRENNLVPPAEEMLDEEDMTSLPRAILLVNFLVILTGTGICYLGICSIADAIGKLHEATGRIAKGDFSLPPPVINRPDELGDLSHSFIKMSEAIHKNRIRFEQYSRELEEKVDSRTREIKQIHNQLIQAGKLAAVGELSAGIAHELNNPIGGILGYAQFLHEKMKARADQGDQSSVFYAKYMEFIARESQRCKQIIRNLLRFARSSTMEMSKVNVNVLLADTLHIVTNQMKLEQIHFETHYQDTLPLLRGDANQLQQVFMNILINAIKAIPSERPGRITVATELVKRDKGPHVEIRITDNGCGIPEPIMDKIFNPFFTTRPPGDGTGLGLSLSYGIVKEHQGEILVESIPGEGSIFQVLLPCTE